MVVKSIIDDMLPNIWPLVLFISVVAITLRCAYLFRGSKKFVLHKELLSLVFIIYILCLYYVLTYQDINYGGVNLITFKDLSFYPKMVFDNLVCEYKNFILLLEGFENAGSR